MKLRPVGTSVRRWLEHLVSWLQTGRKLVPQRARQQYLSAGLLALLAAGAFSQVVIDQITTLPAYAAYQLGDRVVTEQQLNRRVQLLGALYGVQRPTDQKKLDQFNRDTAKAVAVSDILDNAAARRGIVIPQKKASDQLNAVIEKSYPEGRDQFLDKLGQLGLGEKNVVAEIRRQMSNARLYDSVVKDVKPISDAELRDLYEKRRSDMVSPETRHVRNIVVSSKNEAQQLLESVRAGQDFAQLATKYSLDKATSAKGGDLGWLAADQLDKRYGAKAFQVAQNEVFGPVQTQGGWNVGQVLGVNKSRPLTFEQAKDQLRQQVKSERDTGAWNKWLKEQIVNADVQYAGKYQPADKNSLPKAESERITR